MEELSLHILDIAKNSVKAKATLIKITVCEDISKNKLTIEIEDNGCGMDKEFLKTVTDPFSTTRTTRKVGLGIPLFKAAAQRCGGDLEIFSETGKGTTLRAWFEHNHIDRAPLGDMAGTMQTLISGSPEIDFLYCHTINDKEFILDTREMRNILGDVPLDSMEVVSWIYDYTEEGIKNIK